jgi:predicted nucleic acid-binding protein
MLLLISDANILIDMEVGGLLASMFSMAYRFAVPDVLYAEELESEHADLLEMGLQSITLEEDLVTEVMAMSQRHRRPSRNDLFALVLASSEECPLLTGDKDLRAAAEAEGVTACGTLWLVTEMVRAQKISTQVARAAYQRMRDSGRRLPWDQAEQMLVDLDAAGLRSSAPAPGSCRP